MSDLKPCGTIAAYRRHQRHGEQPCEACQKVWAAYHRGYINSSPEVRARARAYTKAYGRAARRIAAAHPDEMAALLAEELERGAS